MDESPSVEVGILMPKALTGKGFCDFDQNNPIYKFDIFFVIISTCLHYYVPEIGVKGSFLTLEKMSQKDFEISKILQNLGVKSECRLSGKTDQLFDSLDFVYQ